MNFVSRMLRKCRDERLSDKERGDALESLAAHLFAEIPGVTYQEANRLTMFASQELDIALWNDADPEGLLGFERIFLVECKNWSKKVSSLEVGWFDTKLRMRGLSFGVLIALNGITGQEASRTSAQSIVTYALSEGRTIVVITSEDIEGLETASDFVELLKLKRLQAVVA